MGSVAVEAAVILLREGLEVILVLAALTAFLRRAAPDRMGALRWGALAGLAASLVLAVTYATWSGGAHDDRVEGVTCLVAAALMLWTGGWMWLRSDPRAWTGALKRQAERALASGRVATAVGGIGFLAVFREGAETVLFLLALGTTAVSLGPMLLGLGVAALCLTVLWWVVSRATLRLPLRPLFVATSVFLLAMAARFVGAGIQEFQEQAVVPFTPVEIPDWLADLGVAPSWEALALQIAVLMAVAVFIALPRRKPPMSAAAE
ncbi:iron permease FTR1 [Dankookia rubra]|uniref:Iron permease FTR1 n=1 Tax=Dankookia rubra TaxID=1442381 RepID=A0A4R5QI48_9PROT|nr:FTR1 family protein [Dankookia rubra]TDH62321.1 iron permease FTR1 [Dankookia rubra]